MRNVQSLLSKTPFVTDLQVTGFAMSMSMLIGRLRGNSIKENVPLLTKFELYSHFSNFRNDEGNDAEAELKRSIALFSTRFWIEEKR
jgi:hypothetical protein